MKVAIEVKDRREGDALRRALDDPKTRALVLVLGALMELPSDRARRRVLQYVTDRLDEEEDASDSGQGAG